jgi:hypothetical protein
MMFILLAQTQFTKAQIQGATEAQLVGFFENNMLQVFEKFAQVDPLEKAAYDAL